MYEKRNTLYKSQIVRYNFYVRKFLGYNEAHFISILKMFIKCKWNTYLLGSDTMSIGNFAYIYTYKYWLVAIFIHTSSKNVYYLL